MNQKSTRQEPAPHSPKHHTVPSATTVSLARKQSGFRRFAQAVSNLVGTPAAFAVALAIVLVWGALGPVFHFSDTWQLFINTGTTIVTFLMVFLVQHTQNRETEAIRLQLDELIWSIRAARNQMLDVDELTDEELRALRDEYRRIASKSRRALQERASARHG
jgi:low affinity Fe/Cu permease